MPPSIRMGTAPATARSIVARADKPRQLARFLAAPIKHGRKPEPIAFRYRHPDGTEAGRSEARRADVYRYVVDDDGQAWTEVSVGQADDADDVAAAGLTERRMVRTAQQAALGST